MQLSIINAPQLISNDKFIWHAPCNNRSSPIMGSSKGRMKMLVYSARDTALSLVGAFITAMLFISAATGPLQIV